MVKKRKGSSNNATSGSGVPKGRINTKSTTTTTTAEFPSLLPPELLLNDANKGKKNKSTNTTTSNSSVETLVEGAVYVVRNFFSSKECQMWIDHVENTSSKKLEYVNHPATRFIAHRECYRWQCNDWDMSQKIFDRMQERKILSQLDFGLSASSSQQQYIPSTCNGNLRFYKYEKGMSFGRHIDGSNDTERGSTEVTVLIYLSNCGGGATRFHLPHRSRKESVVDFAPEEGAILFHVHGDKCLDHEADAVTSDEKYILRTDLVYTRE